MKNNPESTLQQRESFTFYYSDARCGAGKTRWALQHMATTEGRFVYVVDRCDVMEKRRSEVTRIAFENDFSALRTAVIRSRQGQSVQREIEWAGERYADEVHCVVIVTHEGMKMSDFSRYRDRGWSIIIDECPSVFDCQSHRTPALAANFEANYALDPVGDTLWSQVRLKSGAISGAHLRDDEALSGFQTFHKRAASAQGVFVSVHDWQQIAEQNGKRWKWWSLWSPAELAPFDHVTLLANQFERSVTLKLFRTFFPRIEWQPFSIPDRREWLPRRMTIRYFANEHAGSTDWWLKNERGREAIEHVRQYLASTLDDDDLFTCNENLLPVLTGIRAEWRKPRQAGENRFSTFSRATMIYSSKVQPHERTTFAEWEISSDDVIRSREYEDLIQFACRLAVRDPHSTVPIIVTVYSRDQAEALRSFFAASGYVDAALEMIDIGIGDWVRKRPGQRAEFLTISDREQHERQSKASKAERQRQRRAADRAARTAAGTYRGPGRPQRAAGDNPQSLGA